MGVLGEMFPGRKLRSEAGEAGSGQRWRFNLDSGVIEMDAAEPEKSVDPAQDPEPDPGD